MPPPVELGEALKYIERLSATLCCRSADLAPISTGAAGLDALPFFSGASADWAVPEVVMLNHLFHHQTASRWMLVSGLVILAACSPPVERPTGWARAYQDVTDTFIKSDFDRALTFSDPIVSTSPTNAYTDKALVLRAVIYAGEVKAYKELEDAYTKGIQAAKSPGARSDFERVRTDYREYAAKAALGLAEAALKVTQGGSLPKDLAFEATYPSVEGPTVVKELDRV
ncbi:MAG: hypothetical protein DMG21_18280, partial [Acidobacteria bacterium]